MLMMVEKGIRGGIYHAIQRYLKAKNNIIITWKILMKTKKTICMDGQCRKNCL